MPTIDSFLDEPIEDGDAGIVIKANGDFQVFTTVSVDPAKMTDAQAVQGRNLQILALVLGHDELRQQIGELVDQLNAAGVDILQLESDDGRSAVAPGIMGAATGQPVSCRRNPRFPACRPRGR